MPEIDQYPDGYGRHAFREVHEDRRPEGASDPNSDLEEAMKQARQSDRSGAKPAPSPMGNQ